MPKKLTNEYVKDYIDREGYVLLSEYKNSKIKLLIRCPKGHKFEMRFNNFQRGQKCPICNKGIKLTNEYVKNYIDKDGYKLLSDYKNSQTKILLRCPEGHEYETVFPSFKKGHRCPYCKGNKRLTCDYIKSYIESFDYKLLSSAYINNQTKLLVKCPEGHEYETTFNIFKKGHRCFECTKHSTKEFEKMINNDGYSLVSDNIYKDVYTKFIVQCPKKHQYKTTFKSFSRGNRCPVCNINNKKDKYDDIKMIIEKEKYELLSDTYEDSHKKLDVRCPEGHEYSVKWCKFKRGQRCSQCSNRVSKQEKELQDYIESLGYDIIRNDRTQILNPLTDKNLELDIWIPDKNKAIEYNGTYWHSFEKRKINDKIKKDQCKQKGIDLLIVNEEKWQSNRQMEIQRIEKWLNV
jgi:hypothetical protein